MDSEKGIKRGEKGRFLKGTMHGPGHKGRKRTLRADCYARLTEEERQEMIAKQFEKARNDCKHGLEFLKWLEGPSPKDSKYDQPDEEGAVWDVDPDTIIKTLQKRIERIAARGATRFGNGREQREVEDAVAPRDIERETNGHSNGRTQSFARDDATEAWEE